MGARARGAAERRRPDGRVARCRKSTSWRHPVDLVALCAKAEKGLRETLDAACAGKNWKGHAALAWSLLADDPVVLIDALLAAARAGAAPVDLARAVAYAAALRVARFGTANEHADWESAHHVFTYANANHQLLKRIGTGATPAHGGPDVSGILHGAMAIYLTRYLNVPAAALPGEPGASLGDLPEAEEAIGKALLDAFDRQRQVDAAGRLVARHLTLGYAPDAIVATLARALLREDAGFHAYQMLEAGVRQFREWDDPAAVRHILVAVARYLAAHAPTERAVFQTADVARRLLRGGELHEHAAA